MEWHLRKIDEELGKRVKLAALERGLTLRAFVVEVLTAACGGTGPSPAQAELSPKVEQRIMEQVTNR